VDVGFGDGKGGCGGWEEMQEMQHQVRMVAAFMGRGRLPWQALRSRLQPGMADLQAGQVHASCR
jgi:hypothetical protein